MTNPPSRGRLELIIPPPVIFLAFMLLMWLSGRFLPALDFVLPASRAIAAIFVIAGLAFAGLGIAAFRRAGTTVHPLHPEKATALVVGGVYRISRNPMYAGMLLLLTGWACWLSHGLSFAFLPLFVWMMNRLQIRPEERALAAKFGVEYQDYRSAVRRWL